jgi:hypothetical protein
MGDLVNAGSVGGVVGLAARANPIVAVSTGLVGVGINRLESDKAHKKVEDAEKVLGSDVTNSLGNAFYESDGKIGRNDFGRAAVDFTRSATGLGAAKEHTHAAAFIDRQVDQGRTRADMQDYLKTNDRYANVNAQRDASGNIVHESDGDRKTKFLDAEDHFKIKNDGSSAEFNQFLTSAEKGREGQANVSKPMMTTNDFNEFRENRDKVAEPDRKEFTAKAHQSLRSGTTLDDFNDSTDRAKERDKLLHGDDKDKDKPKGDDKKAQAPAPKQADAGGIHKDIPGLANVSASLKGGMQSTNVSAPPTSDPIALAQAGGQPQVGNQAPAQERGAGGPAMA